MKAPKVYFLRGVKNVTSEKSNNKFVLTCELDMVEIITGELTPAEETVRVPEDALVSLEVEKLQEKMQGEVGSYFLLGPTYLHRQTPEFKLIPAKEAYDILRGYWKHFEENVLDVVRAAAIKDSRDFLEKEGEL